jgi:hypothetical protein
MVAIVSIVSGYRDLFKNAPQPATFFKHSFPNLPGSVYYRNYVPVVFLNGKMFVYLTRLNYLG